MGAGVAEGGRVTKKRKNGERDWPATRPEMWPLSKIKPYPNNPRTHPPTQIALLAELMKRHGVDQPIVVDEDGVILKGHGRLLAAPLAGFDEFPVVVHHGVPETEKIKMRLQDNQVALLSGWDQELVRGEMGVLTSAGENITLLGFPEAQLRGWNALGMANIRDPDVVPASPKKPIVRLGDIWDLDKHRIIVGDAMLPATWKTLFGQDRAAMIFTDPPYGVSYEARSGKFEVITGDNKRRDDLYKMLLTSLREMVRYANARAGIYIWHASSTREDFAQAMKVAGIVERQYLIWVKPSIVLGHSDYRWQHEPCFYASKADQKPAFYGDRSGSTVWRAQIGTSKEIAVTIGTGIVLLDGEGGTLFVQSRAPKNKKLRQIRLTKDINVFLSGADRQDGTVWEVSRDGQHEHPTQKPVELARRAIENSSQAGEIVADGFLGSGTTLIGAEMTARRCFAIELDPVYAEVAIRRWERFTGRQATLRDTGETLESRGKHATGHSRKPIPGGNSGGDRAKRGVRQGLHARRASARGKPDGEPPIVAGDT